MEWTNPTYKKFAEDMLAAGLTPYDYKGRRFFQGPAVTVENVTDVTSKTKVECTWEDKEKHWVVHPRP